MLKRELNLSCWWEATTSIGGGGCHLVSMLPVEVKCTNFFDLCYNPLTGKLSFGGVYIIGRGGFVSVTTFVAMLNLMLILMLSLAVAL